MKLLRIDTKHTREAKLLAAEKFLRAAFREAAEAGLKSAEILEFAQKILKEKKRS